MLANSWRTAPPPPTAPARCGCWRTVGERLSSVDMFANSWPTSTSRTGTLLANSSRSVSQHVVHIVGPRMFANRWRTVSQHVPGCCTRERVRQLLAHSWRTGPRSPPALANCWRTSMRTAPRWRIVGDLFANMPEAGRRQCRRCWRIVREQGTLDSAPAAPLANCRPTVGKHRNAHWKGRVLDRGGGQRRAFRTTGSPGKPLKRPYEVFMDEGGIGHGGGVCGR